MMAYLPLNTVVSLFRSGPCVCSMRGTSKQGISYLACKMNKISSNQFSAVHYYLKDVNELLDNRQYHCSVSQSYN